MRSRPAPEPTGDPLYETMLRIAGGDQGALSRLYDATSARVYGLALHILRDPQAAEEATLDAFTQVWRRASSYDAGRGSVIGWILTVARTRAIDLLRSRTRRRDLEDTLDSVVDLPDPGPGPEETTEDAANARKLRVALAALSHDQRTAIEAAYFGGLSHTEVAQCLGQPLGTVKTRIRDGLATLRRMMAAQQEGSAS
jgi:RNA polymerase sigma-70 factor (ECF subfamily)